MDVYLSIGFILAGILIAVYVTVEARARRMPDIRPLVELVLSGTAVTAGIRVGVLTIRTHHLAPFHDEDRIYLVLGALSLVVVSCQTVVGVFRRQGSIQSAAQVPEIATSQPALTPTQKAAGQSPNS